MTPVATSGSFLGMTALDLAYEKGRDEQVAILEAAGAPRGPPVPIRHEALEHGAPSVSELERLKRELESEKRARLEAERAVHDLRSELAQVKASLEDSRRLQDTDRYKGDL